MIASLLNLPAEDWTALAAWSTVMIAVLAGVVALRQLGEARRLRLEQAQPYVVAFLQESQAGEFVIDLVVKNFGATAATDVRVRVSPTPQRSAGGDAPAEVVIPESFPVLVPGQEWRTFWDTGFSRHDSGLPDRHEATVTFSDSRGAKPFKFQFVLDWAPLKSRDVISTYGMHHAAQALREMKKLMDRWQEGASGGLKVYARDGDARDARFRERIEERRAQGDSSP